MFTGIIQNTTTVLKIGSKLILQSIPGQSIKIGSSIAINGCCLTLVKQTDTEWSFDVVPETLNRTNLKALKPQDKVNLEFPLTFGSPLDGHIVQGHVDVTVPILSRKALPDGSFWFTVEIPDEISQYMIEKGSVALDGVSLTIADVTLNSISIALIPHTAEITILGLKNVGDHLNLEVDMMAKYAEKLISPYKHKASV